MPLAEISAHGWVSLAVLAAAVVLFLSKRVPIPVVALSIPIVLYATGALDAHTAMRGFGNFAALAIAAVFVLGAGLRESGVSTLLAKGLERLGGRAEGRLVALLMAAAGLLSAFMSNAAVVAILLPVGIALSRRSGVAPSHLLMPIAFAAVLGGTITVIGTQPNFLIDDFLRGRTGAGFEVFDFAPVGLTILLTGIVFMVLLGRRLLPLVRTEDRFAAASRCASFRGAAWQARPTPRRRSAPATACRS
jgi:di/tricarboxylate transporter